MVKPLITFAVVVFACCALAQRVTHRDPRYLAELSSGSEQSFDPPRQAELVRWQKIEFGLVTTTTAVGDQVLYWTNAGTLPLTSGSGKDTGVGVVSGGGTTTNKPFFRSVAIGTNGAVEFGPVINQRGNYLQFDMAQNNGTHANWTNAELYVVIRAFADPPGSSASNSWAHWESPGVVGNIIFPATDGKIYETFGTSVRKNSITKTNDLRNWSVYHVITRTNFYRIRLNGNLIYDSTTNHVFWPATALFIGTDNPAGNTTMFAGQVAELLMWGNASPPLTSLEQQEAYGYLTNKFGVTNFLGFTMP